LRPPVLTMKISVSATPEKKSACHSAMNMP
jgi:hypothetical protein